MGWRTPNYIYFLGAAGGMGGLWLFSFLMDDMQFGLGGFVMFVVFFMVASLLLNAVRLAIIQKRQDKEKQRDLPEE